MDRWHCRWKTIHRTYIFVLLIFSTSWGLYLLKWLHHSMTVVLMVSAFLHLEMFLSWLPVDFICTASNKSGVASLISLWLKRSISFIDSRILGVCLFCIRLSIDVKHFSTWNSQACGYSVSQKGTRGDTAFVADCTVGLQGPFFICTFDLRVFGYTRLREIINIEKIVRFTRSNSVTRDFRACSSKSQHSMGTLFSF